MSQACHRCESKRATEATQNRFTALQAGPYITACLIIRPGALQGPPFHRRRKNTIRQTW
uniref:Uncharacterized protein n=1 Tax=Anguilla anguilla TaxID=7936 RepID=A0A0E9V468_ANGAN